MYIHVLEHQHHNSNGGKKTSYLTLLEHLLGCCVNSLSGDHGNQWQMGAVNVDIGAEFYFIIEGK